MPITYKVFPGSYAVQKSDFDRAAHKSERSIVKLS